MPERAYVKSLNRLFALFTLIKLLMLLFLYGRQTFLRVLFSVLGTNDVDKAVASLSSQTTAEGLLINISLYLASVAVPTALYFALRKTGKDDNGAYFTRKPKIIEYLCSVGSTFAVSYFVSITSYIIFQLFLRSRGYWFSPPVSEIPQLPALYPLFIVFLCVCPALSEETLIRGAGVPLLSKAGRGFAVIMSALSFMMLHNSVSNLVFALTAGLCMSFFAVKFNSIKVAIVTHFLLNLNSAVLQLWLPSAENTSDFMGINIYFVLVALFSIVFFIVTLLLFGVRLPKTEGAPKFEKRIVLRCPFFYVFILIFAISAINGVISMFTW